MTDRPAAATVFQTFTSWRDVLVHAQSGAPLYYHAPMDFRPRLVRVQIRGRAHSVVLRVFPGVADVDPFTADAKHLDRFKHLEP